MLIYLLFLVIPLIASFFYSSSKKKGAWTVWLFFIPLLIFTGLRDEVGPDWFGYSNIFDQDLLRDLSDLSLTGEPGFFLVNKFSDAMGLGLYGVMVICAFIFLFGVFSYALKTENPWMAIAVVTPYLIFVVSMSGIRQASAIGLGFFMLSRWKESSFFVKLFLIALAMSFHVSAAIFLFFMIFSGKNWKILRFLAVVGVAVFLVMSFKETRIVENYQNLYIDNDLISGGAFFHVLLSAFPAALYLLKRKKIVLKVAGDSVVDMTCYMVLASMPLLLLSSTAIDRLTLYFSFIQMWIYPALIKTYRVHHIVTRIAISILALTIFFGYFLLGTHAFAYLPYNNIWFD